MTGLDATLLMRLEDFDDDVEQIVATAIDLNSFQSLKAALGNNLASKNRKLRTLSSQNFPEFASIMDEKLETRLKVEDLMDELKTMQGEMQQRAREVEKWREKLSNTNEKRSKVLADLKRLLKRKQVLESLREVEGILSAAQENKNFEKALFVLRNAAFLIARDGGEGDSSNNNNNDDDEVINKINNEYIPKKFMEIKKLLQNELDLWLTYAAKTCLPQVMYALLNGASSNNNSSSNIMLEEKINMINVISSPTTIKTNHPTTTTTTTAAQDASSNNNNNSISKEVVDYGKLNQYFRCYELVLDDLTRAGETYRALRYPAFLQAITGVKIVPASTKLNLTIRDAIAKVCCFFFIEYNNQLLYGQKNKRIGFSDLELLEMWSEAVEVIHQVLEKIMKNHTDDGNTTTNNTNPTTTEDESQIIEEILNLLTGGKCPIFFVDEKIIPVLRVIFDKVLQQSLLKTIQVKIKQTLNSALQKESTPPKEMSEDSVVTTPEEDSYHPQVVVVLEKMLKKLVKQFIRLSHRLKASDVTSIILEKYLKCFNEILSTSIDDDAFVAVCSRYFLEVLLSYSVFKTILLNTCAKLVEETRNIERTAYNELFKKILQQRIKSNFNELRMQAEEEDALAPAASSSEVCQMHPCVSKLLREIQNESAAGLQGNDREDDEFESSATQSMMMMMRSSSFHPANNNNVSSSVSLSSNHSTSLTSDRWSMWISAYEKKNLRTKILDAIYTEIYMILMSAKVVNPLTLRKFVLDLEAIQYAFSSDLAVSHQSHDVMIIIEVFATENGLRQFIFSLEKQATKSNSKIIARENALRLIAHILKVFKELDPASRLILSSNRRISRGIVDLREDDVAACAKDLNALWQL